MPNRTYIQMYVKGYEAGRKDIMTAESYNILRNLSGILDENPELVERVVKERVTLAKHFHWFGFAGNIPEHEWVFYERMIIGSWEHEELVRERRERGLPKEYGMNLPNEFCIIDEPGLFFEDCSTMSPKEYGMKLQRSKRDYLRDDHLGR